MKKLFLSIAAAFVLLASVPTQVNGATVTTPTSLTAVKPIESPEAKALLARLDEIKAMDKSNMSFSEKKHLRKETRSIKSHLRAIGGGVYLSAGAIILIVVLLIILL